jgi:hypothetical protein
MPLPGSYDRCTATTRDGRRCKNPAVGGSTVCRMHGGNGGAPEGNANGATHGAYGRLDAPPEKRLAFLRRRRRELESELGAARQGGRAARQCRQALQRNRRERSRLLSRLRAERPEGPAETSLCTNCRELKPASAFYERTGGDLSAWCRQCNRRARQARKRWAARG